MNEGSILHAIHPSGKNFSTREVSQSHLFVWFSSHAKCPINHYTRKAYRQMLRIARRTILFGSFFPSFRLQGLELRKTSNYSPRKGQEKKMKEWKGSTWRILPQEDDHASDHQLQSATPKLLLIFQLGRRIFLQSFSLKQTPETREVATCKQINMIINLVHICNCTSIAMNHTQQR